MVVYLFRELHDEYISSVEAQYYELWYHTDASNLPWDPNDDDIPF